MKRILTSDDVLALVRRGETELVMGPEDRLTDLARELAQRRGVKLVDAARALGQLPNGCRPAAGTPARPGCAAAGLRIPARARRAPAAPGRRRRR